MPAVAPRFLVLLLSLLAFALAASPKDNNGGFDHRAHAVPGGPYSVPDADSDGFAVVKLNGELSHSHYFNPKTGATGRVTKYFWFVNGKQVCTRMICYIKFPLGTTKVDLRVVDNTGDSASASTRVAVYKGSKPALRFWYYPLVGWLPDSISAGQPKYSTTERMINKHSRNTFPQFLLGKRFSIRVLGNIQFQRQGNYRFRLACMAADCTMWIGNVRVLNGRNGFITSKPMIFSKGTKKLHIIYRHQNPKRGQPKFVLSWQTPGRSGMSLVPPHVLSHNPASYKPVVHSVYPAKARVGNVITIVGSSLLNVAAVKIGKSSCAGPVSKNQFTLKCVVPGITGKYELFVRTGAGSSNSVPITISFGSFGSKFGSDGAGVGPVGYYQPVRFRSDFLKRNGKVFNVPQLTSIALGPDNQFYMGSLGGIVHVIRTDLGNQVKGYCKSTQVGKSRSILGLAFNPAEKHARLYASTSVLYWGTKKLLPFTRGWNNGEVIAMQKTKKSCLTRVATVVSGLPVSNYDHSVNGLSFDMGGNLLIQVGGGTNAGVSKKGDPLGGVPDSPLSGAMLWAPILKKGFNGRVAYNQYIDPGRANKVRGDVFVYAAGLRNSYSSIAHSNGHIYATDNGANAKFGPRSMGCGKEGGIATEPDTLKRLKRGGFYGYANRNRGRRDGRQCRHRSPQLNEGGYDKPIAKMESSTTGLLEYTANTFGAQMRGDLLATKFAVSGSGKVYRVQLKGDGTVKSMFNLATHSGLAAVMSPVGAIIMPRVYQGRIAVLLPNEKNPGRMVVTSVHPFRGPKRGGGKVTITGWNLKPPLTITVGGKPCTNVGEYKGGRSVTCRVPRGSGRAAVVVKRFGKKSKSFGYEYVYMTV
ncbi:hypothetical protein BWQ96_02912 [Gracilariopsis chorda]|uniref:PA14 domain-containing protein n=1 Tax=Gracilariopsis chorda TaxID=448386 RepID=A0A2V3IYX4_9FLOR|nr:hypothetical protein BWQ96_02912 [Gracilariopsis chorda]|eukprot:PXF47299.1 hypothetical protein BWQ96_02912 [Gracilariopsis chorda]